MKCTSSDLGSLIAPVIGNGVAHNVGTVLGGQMVEPGEPAKPQPLTTSGHDIHHNVNESWNAKSSKDSETQAMVGPEFSRTLGQWLVP